MKRRLDESTLRQRRLRERKRREKRMVLAILMVILVISCLVIAGLVIRHKRTRIVMGSDRVQLEPSLSAKGPREVTEMDRPPLDVRLLTVNEYSRPGFSLDQVKGIVVHYTANPGTSAMENRNYFEGLKDSHATKASSHFIIGTEGEIVQCIPCDEWSYASNERNKDTISIECCILDDSGKFTGETYDSLVELVSWLCFRYELTADDLLRHYDVTGKNCPKYFVEHEEEWESFLEDVTIYMENKTNE